MAGAEARAWPEARFSLERVVEAGLALRRRSAGSRGSRGTILYIHGLGESALCFERVMCDRRLDAWTHLAPDLAGYGKSPWPLEPASLEQHAHYLEALLDQLELEDVVLVGHSMGGVIGTYLTERDRQRSRLFVNVEGNISPADCTQSALIAAHSLEEWLDGGREIILDELHRSALESQLENLTDGDEETPSSPAVLQAYAASLHFCDPRVLHRNSVELVEESAALDLADRLGKLEVPAVYIYGNPGGTGTRSRALLAEAGIDIEGISPAGHWPYLDQHEAFVDTLLRHLSILDN